MENSSIVRRSLNEGSTARHKPSCRWGLASRSFLLVGRDQAASLLPRFVISKGKTNRHHCLFRLLPANN